MLRSITGKEIQRKLTFIVELLEVFFTLVNAKSQLARLITKFTI